MSAEIRETMTRVVDHFASAAVIERTQGELAALQAKLKRERREAIGFIVLAWFLGVAMAIQAL